MKFNSNLLRNSRLDNDSIPSTEPNLLLLTVKYTYYNLVNLVISSIPSKVGMIPLL